MPPPWPPHTACLLAFRCTTSCTRERSRSCALGCDPLMSALTPSACALSALGGYGGGGGFARNTCKWLVKEEGERPKRHCQYKRVCEVHRSWRAQANHNQMIVMAAGGGVLSLVGSFHHQRGRSWLSLQPQGGPGQARAGGRLAAAADGQAQVTQAWPCSAVLSRRWGCAGAIWDLWQVADRDALRGYLEVSGGNGGCMSRLLAGV